MIKLFIKVDLFVRIGKQEFHQLLIFLLVYGKGAPLQG